MTVNKVKLGRGEEPGQLGRSRFGGRAGECRTRHLDVLTGVHVADADPEKCALRSTGLQGLGGNSTGRRKQGPVPFPGTCPGTSRLPLLQLSRATSPTTQRRFAFPVSGSLKAIVMEVLPFPSLLFQNNACQPDDDDSPPGNLQSSHSVPQRSAAYAAPQERLAGPATKTRPETFSGFLISAGVERRPACFSSPLTSRGRVP